MGRPGRIGTPSSPSAAAGTSDHGLLSGLDDDDHPQYETSAEAAAKVTAHSDDTTAVHGITDTSALETASGSQAKVDTHSADTTAVHGITDTSVLETTTGSQGKVDTHAAASDPHAEYLKESAAAAVATSGSASDLATGTLPIGRIADAAVTLAKIANIATARILGRLTAGSGVTEELTAAQVAAAISPSLPYSGALTADVTTSETTASTTYVDLTTVGPSVTATIGASGMALVIVSARMSNSTSTAQCFTSVSLDAATPADVDSAQWQSQVASGLAVITRQTLVTGLSPGSHTFKLQYRVGSNTGTFAVRRIVVIPL